MSLTERLAEYALSLKGEAIKPEVMETAKMAFIDCLGCIIAGSGEKVTQIALNYCRKVSGLASATVLANNGVKLDPSGAAFVNGIAAHILDYDDGTTAMRGHPSSVVLPVVFALGEAKDASIRTALEAYITGIEVCGLVGRGLNPGHYTRGWHNTSTIGIFGATAAAARLLGLDRQQLTNAFGIAASEASGVKGNFGTMTKSLHVGRAAAKGIFAAGVALEGFESNRNIMEVEHGGFPSVTTGAIKQDIMYKTMEDRLSCFVWPGLTFKVYPSCRATHNGITAIQEIMREHSVAHDEIEHILCRVQPVTKDLLTYTAPRNPLEGKFSMNYCVALAALGRKVGLEDFEGDTIDDPEIIALMEKVELQVDDTLADGAYFRSDYRWDLIMELTVKGGQMYEKRICFGKGEPGNEMSKAEMMSKFRGCLARRLDLEKAGLLIEMVGQLELVPTIKDLVSAIDVIPIR